MHGLKVYTRDGGSPSVEEIDAANRVANSNRYSKRGVITINDPVSGINVEYHPYKNIAFTKGGVTYFYSKTSGPDCQCRTLNLQVVGPTDPILTIVDNPDGSRTYTMYGWDGSIVLQGTGTFVGGIMTNWPSGGVLVGDNWNGGLSNGPSATAVTTPWSPSYSELVAEGEIERPRKTLVYLNDGTVLLEIDRMENNGGDATNVPYSQSWSGGGTVTLQNYEAGSLVSTSVYPVEVPEDVCLPTYDDGGTGMQTAIERYREFRKACSDALIAKLTMGEISPYMRYLLKISHPLSLKIQYPQLPIVDISDHVVTVVNVYDSSVIVTRTGTIQYTKSDGNVVTENVNGTATVLVQRHITPGTDAYSYTVSFENFVAIIDDDSTTENGERGKARLINTFPSIPKPNGAGTFSAMDDIQENAAHFFQDSDFEALAYVLNGSMVRILDANTNPEFIIGVDSNGDYFQPAIPDTSYAIEIGNLPILETYRNDIKPQYDADLANDFRGWLDSGHSKNEMVTIYPIQYASDTLGDLGAYPTDNDLQEATGIYLTKGYIFKYSYTDGNFSFIGTRPIKDKRTGEISERINFPLLAAAGGGATIEDALAILGFSTVDQLYASVGATNEAEFLAILGLSSMQQFIDIVTGGEGASGPRPTFVFKSSRNKTNWSDVDTLYTQQQGDIKGQFDETNLTLNGLYDFLS